MTQTERQEEMGDRVHKSLLNARVNVVFYFLTLFLAFFSRKIFLDCLGTDFIGLTGTLGNILGYLNLAELGISASVGYFLFRPIQSGNRAEIQDILSVLGYLYSKIGLLILTVGVLVSLSFPFVFSNTSLGLGIVYFSFYSLLGSALVGYFINYRQILLAADQKTYLVAIYTQGATLAKTALQIFLAYTYKDLYLWVSVEFVFGLLGCVILNWKINREYPWLRVNRKNGRALLSKYPDINGKTRQIFIHKIKDFLLVKSDELFIFIFVSLKMVALYGNYLIIVSKLISLFSSITGSIGAGIGNLVAEGNRPHILRVFWQVTTMQHFIAAFLCFSLYNYLEPFVALWLGDKYILDHGILVLLLVFIYITNSRNSVDCFNYAYGLYADVWSAWTELVINLTVTVIFGLKWGIAGILLGKISSLLAIVVLWKPYYLFHSGFKASASSYWAGVSRNYVISALSIAVPTYILRQTPVSPYQSLVSWMLYASIGTVLFLLLSFPLNLLFAKGAKDCIRRFLK